MKLGMLITNSDNYYGLYHEIDKKAMKEIVKFTEENNIDLLTYGPIKNEIEARQARKFFENENIDYLIIMLADFSTGDIMMAFEDVNFSMGVWFKEEPFENGDIQLNAAVSANLFSSIAMRKFEKKVNIDWYYGNILEENMSKKLLDNIMVSKAIKNFLNSKIGLIGDVAPTFYNLENNKLNDYFPNIKFERIDIKYILEKVNEITDEEIERSKNLILNSCNKFNALDKSLLNSAKVYAVLEKYIKENNINAIAGTCWPDFQEGFQIVPCVIYSLLGSELGVPVACEGDIGGAISLLIAKELSNSNPTLMDLTSLNDKKNELLLWHCGIGSKDFQPEEGVEIISHPMLDRKNPNRELMGLSYNYAFKPQKATILRYSNDGRILGVDSDIIPSNKGYSGTRGFFTNFKQKGNLFSVTELVDTIFENGIEHHLIICPNNIESRIRKFAKRMNISLVEIERGN